ncbi:MAG: HdeD family acid-resistance protein [Mycetocola sp.]
MPGTTPVSTGQHPYWGPLALRGVLSFAVGVAVTFSIDHSASQGMLLFGVFAIVSAVAVGAWSIRVLDAPWSRFAAAQAVITLVAGVCALALQGADVTVWLLLMACWAGASGVVELIGGIRARGRVAYSREWVFSAALTMVLAIVFVVVPSDFFVQYGGMENVPGAQTASVLTVGVFGAYAAILGVYLVIAALSYKWGTEQDDAVTATTDQEVAR